MRFIGDVTPAQSIASYPRATYRIVIERNPLAQLSFATGTLQWRSVVQDVVNNSSNPAASALGGAADVLNTDRVATIDFRSKTTAGSSVKVADLITAVQGASPWARMVSIERNPPVPGFRDGGPDALAADRERTQQQERERADADSFTSTLARGLRTTRTVAIVLAVAAVAVAAYIYLPRRGAAQ